MMGGSSSRGTVIAAPQAGQRVRCPALLAGTLYDFGHSGQAKAILGSINLYFLNLCNCVSYVPVTPFKHEHKPTQQNELVHHSTVTSSARPSSRRAALTLSLWLEICCSVPFAGSSISSRILTPPAWAPVPAVAGGFPGG